MTDSFRLHVDALPFDCDIDVFDQAVRRAMFNVHWYLAWLIEQGEEQPGATYSGLVCSPVREHGRPYLDDVLLEFHLGDGPRRRLVNAAAKLDWMQLNPGVSMETVFAEEPWRLGSGQFRFGHAVVHRGFPGAGSGLSQANDRKVMVEFLDKLTDGIARHCSAQIAKRGEGQYWAGGDNTPRPEYAQFEALPEGATLTRR
ncbi:hypothetical protein L336_0568 [Candidatus Saccharimonas aalborgensis]|jgi:hypothetical protein|uniref:Uncharacterized protein n=1 Tax=Candidatus Saccharimonas aalborgensis TaxID=1332188 RepID=R4PYI1_9BACT|nr:hypothetical protein [Candidatus Saccharimonas aalborgensis]MBP7775125.1 hypothetical protein [Candidatus Saccharimonas sp.]QQR51027.1 MAG: hypothetical protein IPF89_04660 [Candidatus Saccharibacteria bacterium]AGL62271.1 hypothetical protein L336_0568 [Candidatus Saccharimonas aalborgensis]QQS68777.1 MAG: hypothetical protein IPP24_01985 [Candidatus Saccharibacteria bacterium]QQS71062.1 MAG: hypothetical protein IPP92_02120 [Candidatus Saccharibacteria bacterium]